MNETRLPRIGVTAFNAAARPDRFRKVIQAPQELVVPEGFFVMEDAIGFRTFGKMTGRTRKIWGQDCPTIQRFSIDTVVIDGAIWGVVGVALTGRFAVRPQFLA
jgi:hypothetical protein